MGAVKVTKSDPPETTEILAESIVKLGKALDHLNSSGMNRKAIVLLLQDATKLPKRDEARHCGRAERDPAPQGVVLPMTLNEALHKLLGADEACENACVHVVTGTWTALGLANVAERAEERARKAYEEEVLHKTDSGDR